MTFRYIMLPCMWLITASLASAIDSRKSSWSVSTQWSVATPAEWIQRLPFDDAMPMDTFFNAPPKPPIGCPLKCESTKMES